MGIHKTRGYSYHCDTAATEMVFDNDNLAVFLGYSLYLTSKTEHTSASED